MSEINPTRINQQKVDTGQEVTADGVPIQQAAAPTARQSPPTKEGISSMADLPLTEDSPKAGEIKTSEENQPSTEAPLKTTETVKDEPKVPDYNDFLKAGNNEKFIPEKQKDINKETSEQETKTEDESLKAGIETSTEHTVLSGKQLTKAEKIAQDKKTRDTTGIPDELVPHLKDEMSRPAFDKVTPLLREVPVLKQQVTELTKQLENAKKGNIPDSYYEHPNGVVLTPDFVSASQRVNTSQQIADHWRQQYIDVRGGAAEVSNIGFDTNGNLIETGKVKVTPEAEAEILGLITTTQNQLVNEQANLKTLVATHKDKHSQVMQWLSGYENNRVAIFNTEEGKKYLPQVSEILKSFPPALQSNPLAISVAKRDVVINQLAHIIKTMQGQTTSQTTNGTVASKTTTTQQRVAQTRKAAGPTDSDTGADNGSGGKGNGKAEVTMDQFEAAKNGY